MLPHVASCSTLASWMACDVSLVGVWAGTMIQHCKTCIHHLVISILFGGGLMFFITLVFLMVLDLMVSYWIFTACTTLDCSSGAKLLADEQNKLPLGQKYVRCTKIHIISQDTEFKLIICMSSRMSAHLLQSKRLSIDTSFKRVQGWQEFEIESWDGDHMRCNVVASCCTACSSRYYTAVVSTCAFTTSQSVEAYIIFFRRIFEIATMSYPIYPRFSSGLRNPDPVWSDPQIHFWSDLR
jgi:hypothetical protein